MEEGLIVEAVDGECGGVEGVGGGGDGALEWADREEEEEVGVLGGENWGDGGVRVEVWSGCSMGGTGWGVGVDVDGEDRCTGVVGSIGEGGCARVVLELVGSGEECWDRGEG